ncbi:hypothetical protein OOJ91_33620 [Micromonospora lupini]|uniref:hypothetical protein n=1 Tax=Micromonospora lupini TaxID=285679 RepID=UPI002256ADD5|nr:hypothetical protein [Micromonospora lupini]MCX5070786.1 hypothetical protein [Micromonospora lupini]
MPEFEKKAVNLKLSLALDDGLSWGELFRFVELARTSGVDPGDQVPLEYSERDESILEGMAVYLAPEDLPGAAQPTP